MIRLFVIALASLASFFVLAGVAYRLTGNNDLAAWVALALGFVVVPVALLKLWRAPNPASKCPGGKGLYPECMFTVTVTGSQISVTRPDSGSQALLLSDLQEVAIVTNDSGPVGADVWWVISAKSTAQGCTFPAGATGEQDVLRFVQGLPGFNNERFIQAMGSTSNAKFVCWSARD